MNTRSTTLNATSHVLVTALCLMPFSAWADTLETHEFQITSSPDYETTPTLAEDGQGELVVYTSRAFLQTSYGPGFIWFQRLVNGAPVGSPVQVSSGSTDDLLNDVEGGRIVYTAYDSTTSTSGDIVLFDIDTQVRSTLGRASSLREARIHGDNVAWIQGSVAATTVMLYDVAQLGAGGTAELIGGPFPPASSLEIGDRFVVWDEVTNNQRDVVAFDLQTRTRLMVANDPDLTERTPSTHGPYVVWEVRASTFTGTRIEFRNMDTGIVTRIAEEGVLNAAPTVHGNLIAYESRASGNYDIFVYRILEGETYQVTSDPSDQQLNNVFGGLVAYVDGRSGSLDIYVSSLDFISDDPCAGHGGDLDQDGTCDAQDNCAGLFNDQADFDSDGVGDACDNCVMAPNASQADTDGDGVGNACDNCANVGNSDQQDADGDTLGDACDACANDPFNDADSDGVCGDADNCLFMSNATQSDVDGDGVGDACDPCPTDATNDADGDGVCGPPDACGGACASTELNASRTHSGCGNSVDDTDVLCRSAQMVIPATLPVVRGNAGQQWASLYFTRPDGAEIRCKYRGDQTTQGCGKNKWKKGDAYRFDKCTGTSQTLRAGDIIFSKKVRLTVHGGEARAGKTEVKVTVFEQGGGACEQH